MLVYREFARGVVKNESVLLSDILSQIRLPADVIPSVIQVFQLQLHNYNYSVPCAYLFMMIEIEVSFLDCWLLFRCLWTTNNVLTIWKMHFTSNILATRTWSGDSTSRYFHLKSITISFLSLNWMNLTNILFVWKYMYKFYRSWVVGICVVWLSRSSCYDLTCPTPRQCPPPTIITQPL